MIDIGTDELYELASIAKSDPYGHPYEQVLDNFGNFRCLMTPSLIMWLIDSLREAEKDAARYRFIRDESTDYHIGEFFSTEVNDRDDCIDSLIEQLNLRMNRLKAKAIIK